MKPWPAVLLALSMATTSCAGSRVVVGQKKVLFRVEGERGRPVANASLVAGGRTLAATDSLGEAFLTLSGREGDTVDVAVVCPVGFQSPPTPLTVSLRRLVGEKPIEYLVTCPPKTRVVVVAVNALRGHRIPIVELGRTIGETDESGVATLLLSVERNAPFEISLDTSGPDNAWIRPRSPTASFSAHNEDEVLVFDPQLTLERPAPPVARRAPREAPRLPVRIQ